MKFSIVIPVYNVELFVENAIDSCLQQALPFYEILLVNDGSTDRSGEICDRYAQEHASVQVVHQENRGVSCARNAGIHAARGDYILFLDSDDFLHLDTTAHFNALAVEHDCPDVLFGAFQKSRILGDGYLPGGIGKQVMDYDLPVSRRGPEVLTYLIQSKKYSPHAWLKVCRTQFLREKALYFVDGVLREDDEWSMRLFWQAESVCASPKVFYYYRTHENSITQNPNPKGLCDHSELTYHSLEFFAKQRMSPQQRKIIATRFVARWVRIIVGSLENKYYSREEVLRALRPFLEKNRRSFLRGWIKQTPFPLQLRANLSLYVENLSVWWLFKICVKLRRIF